MYLKLSECCCCFALFDYRSSNQDACFCMPLYKFCTETRKSELIETGVYQTNDFIVVEVMKHSDICRAFLNAMNVTKYRNVRIEHYGDSDIEQVCHWYYEDNMLQKEWLTFEKSALTKYASEWCDKYGIAYTAK